MRVFKLQTFFTDTQAIMNRYALEQKFYLVVLSVLCIKPFMIVLSRLTQAERTPTCSAGSVSRKELRPQTSVTAEA